MTNEDMLLISDLLDKKLKPIRLLLENDLMPRIENIETCYVDTYRRYSRGIGEINAIKEDVSILKQVVREHSEQLNRNE